MANALVDVCIPMHNAFDYVLKCINSLHINTKEKIRLVIHDDASDDENATLVRTFAEHCSAPILLARSEHQCWFTTSVNRCLKYIQSEWVLVVNSDVQILDNEWLEKLIHIHNSNHKCGLIGCPDNTIGQELFQETWQKVQGHFWFFNSSNFPLVGLLDESNQDNIHIRSDDEWSERWRKHGFRTFIATNLRHRHGGDSHPAGGASWGRNLAAMPTRLEHVALARSTPPAVLVDKC